MDRKLFLTLLAGIGAVAVLAGAAIATQTEAPPPESGHEHRGPPPGPGFMMAGMIPPGALPHIAKQLGLTADQQQRIQEFLDQAKPSFRQLREQLRASAELLAKTRPDDPSYTTVVTNVSQAMSGVTAQMVLQGSQLRSQIFGVLNADQKTKFADLQGRTEARGPMGGPGGRHRRGGAADGAGSDDEGRDPPQ